MLYAYRILIALFGALMNHIRGGLLAVLRIKYVAVRDKISYWEANPKVSRIFNTIGKQGNHILFSVVFTASLHIQDWRLALLSLLVLYIGMFGGAAPGWGTYINGMINREIRDEEEISFIDKLVLTGKADHPVLRNTIALSLRGVMWTACLAVAFFILSLFDIASPYLIFGILPVGLLMGPTYLLAMEICQRITTRGNGWQIGEYFWGFVLWGCIAILIGA